MAELGWRYLSTEDKAGILDGIRDGRAYGGPYHVEIYPADRCNIDCFFCSTAAIRGTDELPMERFTELLGELREAGTRSILLAGGGEPLFHRKIKPFLAAIRDARLPVEDLTTNGVLVTDEVAALLTEVCDDVTFSLNTAEAESYAQMMRTPARNFERVVENIRKVVRMRGRGRRPKVRVQFLVWRENYTQIPRMYDLARDVGADAIVFNGLSHLRPDQTMSVDETGEMMRLYEAVVRRDEYRTIETIQSFEQDITPLVREMNDRLTVERSRVHPALRAIRLLGRRDFTLREKIAHHVLQRRRRRSTDPALPTECLIGWYSLVIRSDGLVAPCCIFQATPMGNVFRQSVDEIWNGERYQRFRSELRRIMDEREGWQHDPAADTIVGPLCGATGVGCPVRSFYFQADHEFRRGYARATGARG